MNPSVAPRFDLYATIHKGLRACMTDALVRLGRVDPTDPAEVHDVVEAARAMLALCGSHLAIEDAVIHVAMEARWPGSTRGAADEHAAHVAAADALDALLWALDESGLDERGDLVRRTYSALARFVAEQFEHMQHEETEHNAVLWACWSDVELGAIHRGIVARSGPAERAAVERWVLPAVSPAERAAMVAGMKRNGDAATVVALVRRAQTFVRERDWRKLERVFAL